MFYFWQNPPQMRRISADFIEIFCVFGVYFLPKVVQTAKKGFSREAIL